MHLLFTHFGIKVECPSKYMYVKFELLLRCSSSTVSRGACNFPEQADVLDSSH